MVRWEPGAQERLAAAALELYATQGFEQTTAADVARAVGLTERTFFRYFADKREVLFAGQEHFQRVFVEAVEAAPPEASAMAAVSSALDAAARFFLDERRGHSRQRQSIIDANQGLHERELLKLAGLTEGMAAALRARGVGEPQATLAAHTGVTVFGVAFRLWVGDHEERPLGAIQADVLRDLQALSPSVR